MLSFVEFCLFFLFCSCMLDLWMIALYMILGLLRTFTCISLPFQISLRMSEGMTFFILYVTRSSTMSQVDCDMLLVSEVSFCLDIHVCKWQFEISSQVHDWCYIDLMSTRTLKGITSVCKFQIRSSHNYLKYKRNLVKPIAYRYRFPTHSAWSCHI